MSHPIITIGRELGSGGLAIGHILSELLRIPIYDKEILNKASESSGLVREIFENADEKKGLSFVQRTMSTVFGIDKSYINNDSLFELQSKAIMDLAEKNSCIFVGRCADYILRDRKNVLSVFFSANIEDRISMLKKDSNKSREEIIELIETIDKKRSSYYNYYTNKTWGHASSYNICLNTSVIGLEDCADIIAKIFSKNFLK